MVHFRRAASFRMLPYTIYNDTGVKNVEEQIADLVAQVAALEASSAGAAVTNTMFAEAFYYLTIPLMIIIHAGFLAYEMGASRLKNVLSSGVKNILAFAFMIPTFYFFGWWVYWAFPTGIPGLPGPAGISGIEYANAIALGWGDSAQYMGPNIADQASGVFFGAFAMFAATTASIMSGAVIERIQTVGFIILAIVLGSFAWVVAAAWGWHADGWMVTNFGLHDFGAAGLVHAVAGFFALGVLINLGPRIGKFNADGTANHIPGHNMPLTVVGLMLIIVGFFGFLMACVIVPGESWSWFADKPSTIYGTPITLSALSFNILMAIAGGIIGSWLFTRDPFWMMSGALAGIISAASGLDIYFPAMAFIVAFSAGIILKPCADWLDRRCSWRCHSARHNRPLRCDYVGCLGGGLPCASRGCGRRTNDQLVWSNHRCSGVLPAWFCAGLRCVLHPENVRHAAYS